MVFMCEVYSVCIDNCVYCKLVLVCEVLVYFNNDQDDRLKGLLFNFVKFVGIYLSGIWVKLVSGEIVIVMYWQKNSLVFIVRVLFDVDDEFYMGLVVRDCSLLEWKVVQVIVFFVWFLVDLMVLFMGNEYRQIIKWMNFFGL